jgi:aspartyl-tRNA(Asn)/glutamyl-tRNA(Gln) amidotransferase subunit A
VKRRIMIGTYALSAGYYDAYYGQAQKVRTLITRDFAAAFEQVDVLVSPTAPTTRSARRARSTTRWRCTSTTSHDPGQPGRAPRHVAAGGLSEDGLPVGLQIMAPALADDRLYRWRRARGALLDAGAGRCSWPEHARR